MDQTERKKRKLKQGVVLSNKMNKTVVVSVNRTMLHPKYGKVVKRRTICYAHTEKPLNIGDAVTIMETRPLSKLKRWRVVEAA